ncbi:MAG: flagellar basal body P-ring formation protein FlgA [Deltaproteobacteria bacterium]|jgi:flagella basal body P-ring formation protein FlgA|nr:flagellar basal body P-ring formation protein FlgA [Deltaproteobacteria bacterium]
MCIVLRIKWVLITGMVFLLLSWNFPFVLAGTVVKVPERAKVNSKLISLGEIADIKGEDSQLVEALKSIVLGRAPLPGEMREISTHYIGMKIRQNDIDPTTLTLDLPEKIEVLRESIEISPKEIEKIVKQFIHKKMPWDFKQVTIKTSPAKGIVLATGEITYEVVPRKREDYLGVTNLSVIFMVNGRVERKLWVNAHIDVSKEVVVSNHLLRRHYTITEGDIRLEKMNLAELSANVVTDPLEVIGKRTKRVVDPNLPIKLNFLEVPPLVRRGDLVTIVAESDTLKITTQGIVSENGCKGEVVRVINTNSRKDVYARVVDSRTVAIDF